MLKYYFKQYQKSEIFSFNPSFFYLNATKLIAIRHFFVVFSIIFKEKIMFLQHHHWHHSLPVLISLVFLNPTGEMPCLTMKMMKILKILKINS
ncbi:MAG: hypothetical protein A3I12_01130 [Gammaproteobacteria bacterium RIFCSPLOWO2_02_FULL_38_11]|nr:MAG: hypothetical protein A3I12_01130 [Gammaproteobacteria bacterium RIFCSPLOWO2_02_FULL_38_11]OGT76408.1 MAG: hypothetical protein A3G71_03925 [Gammaproteobacteria bacterium RIFCSPLOWO2_12_FULL_38_14]